MGLKRREGNPGNLCNQPGADKSVDKPSDAIAYLRANCYTFDECSENGDAGKLLSFFRLAVVPRTRKKEG
jgi:hypothetical protein